MPYPWYRYSMIKSRTSTYPFPLSTPALSLHCHYIFVITLCLLKTMYIVLSKSICSESRFFHLPKPKNWILFFFFVFSFSQWYYILCLYFFSFYVLLFFLSFFWKPIQTKNGFSLVYKRKNDCFTFPFRFRSLYFRYFLSSFLCFVLEAWFLFFPFFLFFLCC